MHVHRLELKFHAADKLILLQCDFECLILIRNRWQEPLALRKLCYQFLSSRIRTIGRFQCEIRRTSVSLSRKTLHNIQHTSESHLQVSRLPSRTGQHSGRCLNQTARIHD